MKIRLRIHKKQYTLNTFTLILIVAFMVSLSLIIYAYFRYYDTPYFHTFIFFAILVFIVPVGGYIYYNYTLLQNKEYYFPQFLKDLADGVRAGLSLPQAVMNVSKVNYGALTEDVRKLATHISWGVPFDDAIQRFAERTKSKMIKTSVDLIIEAYLAGGKIADILDTVAGDAGVMHSLKEERKTKFSGFIGTIYAVYVIFLIIVTVLLSDLLPEIPTIPSFGSSGSAQSLGLLGGFSEKPPQTISEDELTAIFFNLAMIEAIFAGLLAGIAGEGSTVAGIKHAIILIFISLVVFQIFIPIPDPKDRLARAVAKMPINVDASVSVGKFFVEENITSEDIIQHVKKYVKKMNFPMRDVDVEISFEEAPEGCEPCTAGIVEIHPHAVIVTEPTYLSFRVKTDVDKRAYVVYVS